MQVSDIRWSSNSESFDIWLDRSKANQEGDGELITIVNYEGCCASKLMKRWFDKMGLWDKQSRSLFPSIKGSKGWDWSATISQSWLRKAVKTLVVNNGGDPTQYSGHSLRAGGATDLFIS